MKKGFTLIEILVAVLIIFIICLISFRLISTVIQKSKVASAKVHISQLALLLEQVKNDTGYYPVFLSDMTSNTPPKMLEKGWFGPYINEIPLDPWKHPYFYKIPPTTLFASPSIPRVSGTPDTFTAFFEGIQGKAILHIENYGLTSCEITLNGVKVLNENELKNKPIPQIIEKEVDILEGNNIFTRARSTPGDSLIFSISSYNIPTGKYFILGSYGKDGKEGGKGFNKDIVWYSDKYPNFQQ
ncbi:MAG TPA: type II secretion system protein GspG [bacterium]|nr:type II secretion system protein GspG [bacterium]